MEHPRAGHVGIYTYCSVEVSSRRAHLKVVAESFMLTRSDKNLYCWQEYHKSGYTCKCQTIDGCQVAGARLSPGAIARYLPVVARRDPGVIRELQPQPPPGLTPTLTRSC